MRRLSLMLLPCLLLPLVSSAAPAPLSTKNLELTGSAGYLGVYNNGDAAHSQAFDAAAGVALSLHPSFALAGNFDHGFPTSGGQHINIARVSGQLRVYPALGEDASKDGLFLQAGPMWIGESSLRDWSGLNTQITYSHSFTAHVFGYAAYAHGFGWASDSGDRDFARIGLGAGSALGH